VNEFGAELRLAAVFESMPQHAASNSVARLEHGYGMSILCERARRRKTRGSRPDNDRSGLHAVKE